VSTTVGIVTPGGALASAQFTFLPQGTDSTTAQSAAISQPVSICEQSTYLLSFYTYVNQGINTDSLTASPITSALTDVVQSLIGTTMGAVAVPVASLLNCQITASIGPTNVNPTHIQPFPFANNVGGKLNPTVALGSSNNGWDPNTFSFATAAGETADTVTLTATCPGLTSTISPTGVLGVLLTALAPLLSGVGTTLTGMLGPDLLTLARIINVQIYVDNVTLNQVNACV
jgi:hypothetical protein